MNQLAIIFRAERRGFVDWVQERALKIGSRVGSNGVGDARGAEAQAADHE